MEGNNPNGDVNTEETKGSAKKLDVSNPESIADFVSDMVGSYTKFIDAQFEHMAIQQENLKLQNELLQKLLDKN